MTSWSPVVDEIVGRFAAAPNLTLLGRAGTEWVIYKPIAGNRPLEDFDVATLAVREVLAYEVAAACGFDLVPETVLGDGPLGPGAIQHFIDEEEGFDPLPLVQQGSEDLWPTAVLDLVVNNPDRKLGHLIRETSTGRLRAIDHGLTFHPRDKLRTVLWVFAGRRLPQPMIDALCRLGERLDGGLADRIATRLGDEEASALERRVAGLLAAPRHPGPPDDRHPVPWPPY